MSGGWLVLASAASETVPVAAPDSLPSADLLLYLSEFEDAGGDFVDPMALAENEELERTDAAPDPVSIEEDDRDDPQRSR